MENDLGVALQRQVILDACSVISLYATDISDQILGSFSGQVHVTSYVEKREVKELFNPVTEQSDIPIDLHALKASGLIKIVRPSPGQESEDAVNYAVQMGNGIVGKNTGEAISGAIAKNRNWIFVTDDVKATKFFVEQPHLLDVTTTLHLIQYWEQVARKSKQDVQLALQKIKKFALYGPPPKSHPLLNWWQNYNV